MNEMIDLLHTLDETLKNSIAHLRDVFEDMVKLLNGKEDPKYTDDYVKGFRDGMDIAKESNITVIRRYIELYEEHLKEKAAETDNTNPELKKEENADE